MVVTVLDVNERPEIVIGGHRNVSEVQKRPSRQNFPFMLTRKLFQNAKTNEFLDGPPIDFIDPDINQEHTFSIISSEPPSGMDIFGIGGCTGKVYVKGSAIGLSNTERLFIGVCFVEAGLLNVLLQNNYNLTISVSECLNLCNSSLFLNQSNIVTF
jgi:hypothetical protein